MNKTYEIPIRNVLKRGVPGTKKVAIVTGSSSGIGFEIDTINLIQ